jgi:hypothetical protein
MYFPRVHRDHVASLGLHWPDAAPRALRPSGHHPDPEVVVGVAGKGVGGEERHHLDARERRSMLCDDMPAADHIEAYPDNGFV